MKKKIILISVIFVILSVGIIVVFNNMDNKENSIISNVTKEEPVINSNMITMMYETEAGSGEYTETTDNTWPESGYIFNDILSGCENGGELKYNSINNTVNLLSNSSDACYVYFDKYDGVWIDNVIATNITGSSVTLDVSATSENGSISNYYYSLNDSEYVETNTNPIVIENLNQLTEYNIKIYVIDNTGASSNIYELNVSTTDISVPVINSVEVSEVTYHGFKLTVNVDTSTNRSYYYIIEDAEIAGVSKNNSYTFNDLEDGTIYHVIVYVKDNNGYLSVEYALDVETAQLPLLADYIKSLYTSQGLNGIYYHTSSLANSAGDNSYRYAGANPNNYVCFGSTASTCPSDNLYRIIGVFGNQVKLIKSNYAGSTLLGTNGSYSSSDEYMWNWSNGNSSKNDWSQSDLNKINLNTNYLSYLDSIWENLISNYNWKVGGGGDNLRYGTPHTVYNYEVGSNSSSTTYNAKIGLMYISDYAFAASNEYWTTSVYYGGYNQTNVKNNNWLFGNFDDHEWTISRTTNSEYNAYAIHDDGAVDVSYGISAPYYIRPCFYLNSNVQYASGSGTESDPIRLVV